MLGVRKCEKIRIVCRAGISSKFYNCDCLEGKGNKALQLANDEISFSPRGVNVKRYCCKTFSIPMPRPHNLKQIFYSF